MWISPPTVEDMEVCSCESGEGREDDELETAEETHGVGFEEEV